VLGLEIGPMDLKFPALPQLAALYLEILNP
jgi:hypothetical protein